MRSDWQGERGAALVIVLLFMVVSLILIASVLAVTGNEVQIAGLHRDGVRAMELALAGIQEGLQRVRNHPGSYTASGKWQSTDPSQSNYMDACNPGPPPSPPTGFDDPSLTPTAGLGPGENLRVGICGTEQGSPYLEIRADARVGRALRKLSLIVLVVSQNIPPEIVLSGRFTSSGSAQSSGPTYSPLEANYSNNPGDNTYTGWRVGSRQGQTTTWCYRRGPNLNVVCDGGAAPPNNWFPGTRRTVSKDDPDPVPLPSGETAAGIVANIQGFAAGTVSNTQVSGIRADQDDPTTQPPNVPTFFVYDYDLDDPDGGGPTLPQARTTLLPNGLPYKYVQDGYVNYDKQGQSCRVVQTTNNTPVQGCPAPQPLYFKYVIFEDWFKNYYRFTKLQTDPDSYANPPFPRNGSVLGCNNDNPCVLDPNGVPTQAEPKYFHLLDPGDPDYQPNPQEPGRAMMAAIPPFPGANYTNNARTAASVCALNAAACPNEQGVIDDTVVNPADATDTPTNKASLGTPPAEATCPREGGIFRYAFLEDPDGNPSPPYGTYTFTGGWSPGGYGLLFVNSHMRTVGAFEYTGTIFVNGDVEFGGGNVVIHGGLIVRGRVTVSGNLTIDNGDCLGLTLLTNQTLVFVRSFFER